MDRCIGILIEKMKWFFGVALGIEGVVVCVVFALSVAFIAQITLIILGSTSTAVYGGLAAARFEKKHSEVDNTNAKKFYSKVVSNLNYKSKKAWIEYRNEKSAIKKQEFCDVLLSPLSKKAGCKLFLIVSSLSAVFLINAICFLRLGAENKAILISFCSAVWGMAFLFLSTLKGHYNKRLLKCVLTVYRFAINKCSLLPCVITPRAVAKEMPAFDFSDEKLVAPRCAVDSLEDTVFGLLSACHSQRTYVGVRDSLKGAISRKYLKAEDKTRLEKLVGLLDLKIIAKQS